MDFNPLSRRRRATIEQGPSLKSFPLADILSLSAGLLAPQTEARRVHVLVAFLTGTAEDTAAAHAKDAKTCLEEQLPFLKDLDTSSLHAAFRADRAHMDDHLQMWTDLQTRKYGAEHYLMPRARWEKRRNSHRL